MWLVAALLACGPAPPGAGPSGGPTWHQDVAPLVAARCGACHGAAGPGMRLDRLDDAAPRADWMAEEAEARRMPPWLARAGDGCEPPWGFLDDPTLSEGEIALLRAWADAGAPAGDPARAAELPAPPALDHVVGGEALRPPEGTFVEAGADLLACASLGPPLAEERWLLAAELVPGASGAHHANVLVQPAGWSSAPGWQPCAGEAGRARPLVFWAPGTSPLRAPAGAGIRVGAGESLIVQVHWSAGAGAVEPPEVRLQWADEPPAREARLLLLGNASDATEGLLPDPADVGEPEFRIPAGSPEHAEVMVVPVARGGPPARLFAVGHHMHRFGWRMTSRVVGGPCLLDTPDWRYEWHTLYHVDAPEPAWLEVRPDDRVELRCVYRNTLDHPGAAATYQAAGVDQPVDVGLGAGSLDEMCNLLLGVVEEEAPAP